jgi:hypothetical protein
MVGELNERVEAAAQLVGSGELLKVELLATWGRGPPAWDRFVIKFW